MRPMHAAILLISSTLLAGCAGISQDAGFADVQQSLADRLPQHVVWNRGSADDDAAAAEVTELLNGELTADAAVQVALLNNPGLQGTYENLAVAQADLVQAGLLLNPVFDAQIRFAEGGGGVGIDLGIVQDFLDVFQIPLRKRVAAAGFEGAKAQVAGAVIDLATDTRRAHHQLVAAQQRVELRQTVLASYEASHDLAQRLHQAGNITDLQLARERSQFEQSKLDLAVAESTVQVRREQLNALMGVWGQQAVAWQTPPRLAEPADVELDTSALEQQAVANSLNLAEIRQNVFAEAERLGLRSQFALLDNSDLSVGVVGERSAESGDWETGPAFALPIPLFNRGGPAVARAKAVLRRANRQYQQQAVNLRAGVRAAATQLVSARARADYYRGVVLPLRQTVLDQTQLEYNAMLVGAFELLQARRDQVEAGVAYIDSLESYWLARASLEQIVAGRSGDFPMSAPAAAGNATSPSGSMGGGGH